MEEKWSTWRVPTWLDEILPSRPCFREAVNNSDIRFSRTTPLQWSPGDTRGTAEFLVNTRFHYWINVLCAQNKGREVAYQQTKLIEDSSTEHLVNTLKVGWTRREIKNFNDIDNYSKIGLQSCHFQTVRVLQKTDEGETEVVLKRWKHLQVIWNSNSLRVSSEQQQHVSYHDLLAIITSEVNKCWAIFSCAGSLEILYIVLPPLCNDNWMIIELISIVGQINKLKCIFSSNKFTLLCNLSSDEPKYSLDQWNKWNKWLR